MLAPGCVNVRLEHIETGHSAELTVTEMIVCANLAQSVS